MVRRSPGPLPLVLALLLCGPAARAQQAEPLAREQARALGYAGVHAYQAGDYRTANEQLQRAYQLLPAPSLALWSARALEKLGRLVEAQERYQRALSLTVSEANQDVQRQAQLDAQRELALLTPRIPRVRFLVRGVPSPSVTLTLDEIERSGDWLQESRALNPGRHRVVARSDERRADVTFELAEGAERDVALDFAPVTRTQIAARGEQASAHARRNQTLGWIAVGVGGAGVLAGTIAGLSAVAKKTALDESGNCRGNHCDLPEQDRVDSYNSLRTVSTLGFAAGGVFAATGVVLLITSKNARARERASSRAELVLRVHPGGAVLNGRF